MNAVNQWCVNHKFTVGVVKYAVKRIKPDSFAVDSQQEEEINGGL